ncbi:MAG: hypothetical protein ACRC2T_05925, partial [Thermoguttaceae bacterium]
EAYAAGVTVLDQTLGGFFEAVKETYSCCESEPLIIFAAVRGFALGEHKVIGSAEQIPLIYAENVHLPLMIRQPHCAAAMFRSDALVKTSDINVAIKSTLAGSDEKNLFCLINGEVEKLRDYIVIQAGNGLQAVVFPDWFLRTKETETEYVANNLQHELYAKPDDRWEVNEVADRCVEVIEELVVIVDVRHL